MKKIIYFSLSALLTLSLASCRGRQQPTPIVEENIEYRPLVTDSAAIDSINNSGMVDNDAALEMPDIPKDKNVDMGASDAEVMDIMSGTGDGDLTKEADPMKE
ncbi:MAG: hypothetical protein J5484_01020 [Prevotella sp.]|nr:hypothetical protein [Prevotella sp.]